MNKTLLLIICDFLLISILALVEFQPNVEVEAVDEQSVKDQAAEEMLELLQLSLEHEAAQREEVESSLDETRKELDTTSESLQEVSSTLEQREAEKAALEEETRSLSENLQDTRISLELTREEKEQLAQTLSERERQARQLQEELKSQQALAEEKIADLESARENLSRLETEQQQLQTQLQIRDTEKKMLEENLVTARAEVERARIEAERAQERAEDLAVGVTELAASSSALQEEFRQAQPLSMNTIYRQFEDNRIFIRFRWKERLLLGSANRESIIQSALVRTGNEIHALFATENTPFGESDSRRESISAVMSIGNRTFAVKEVGFLRGDPGIVAVRISPQIAEESGLKVLPLSEDPLRFGNAVLVKDDQEMYGEIPVRVPPGQPEYLDIESRLFNRLFGEFNPSAGDYVFSMTGELIGIMTEANRARMLQDPQFGNYRELAMPEQGR